MGRQYRLRYPAHLAVMVSETQLDTIREIAERDGCSMAQVVRDVLDHGMDWRHRASKLTLAKLRARTE